MKVEKGTEIVEKKVLESVNRVILTLSQDEAEALAVASAHVNNIGNDLAKAFEDAGIKWDTVTSWSATGTVSMRREK